jgi:Protein of unknown function (DUF1643)
MEDFLPCGGDIVFVVFVFGGIWGKSVVVHSLGGDMADKFEITGYFYELSGLKCRKYLNIKRVGSNLSHPDIMVVMMNPGSSYPIDGIDDNNAPSETYPDPTQNQIMAVMNNTGFNFARVLNLSDARKSKCADFYDFLKNANTTAHSIFDQSRHEEFLTMFRRGVPVIYAWGVNAKLEMLAKKAIQRISEKNPIGSKKVGSEWGYYHPLPRNHTRQLEWVNNVTYLLSNA